MRTHNVVFVVGAPGAGKTTALRSLALPSDYQTPDTEVRWTLKDEFAFIGHYENKTLDGGDRVARHANLLCLEYWKRNILPNPNYRITFLDGEMYLWSRILESLRGDLSFVKPDEEHYLPGGRYSKSYAQILSGDPSRFPTLPGAGRNFPPDRIQVSCIYLYVSPEVSLARRRAREASAGAGETINSDLHMRTAASKQRNFAEKFKGSGDGELPFFMEATPSPNYLELNVENLRPEEVTKRVERYVRGLK